MKNKKLILLVILGIALVQILWVKIVMIFLVLLESISHDVQFLFLSVVFVPVVEETLYRHVPLSITKNYFPKSKLAVMLASSIVFGLGHIGGFIPNILIQGCLGMSFAFIYLKYGLRYSILSHSLWNLICFLNIVS